MCKHLSLCANGCPAILSGGGVFRQLFMKAFANIQESPQRYQILGTIAQRRRHINPTVRRSYRNDFRNRPPTNTLIDKFFETPSSLLDKLGLENAVVFGPE